MNQVESYQKVNVPEFVTSPSQDIKNCKINIIQPMTKDIYFEFSCDNVEFMMNEFSKVLSRFYNEFNGKIIVKE